MVTVRRRAVMMTRRRCVASRKLGAWMEFDLDGVGNECRNIFRRTFFTDYQSGRW